MAESQHTLGPWETETPCGFPYSGLYIVSHACNKGFPYYIAQIREFRERGESEANARLIAAAPGLLEACQWFMEMIEVGTIVRDISKDAQPDFALKMMTFVQRLAEVSAIIAAARGTTCQ